MKFLGKKKGGRETTSQMLGQWYFRGGIPQTAVKLMAVLAPSHVCNHVAL